jgi:hypothetical protein
VRSTCQGSSTPKRSTIANETGMNPELSPTLLRAGLELAGAVRADRAPTAAGSVAPVPERLGAHQVVRYATVEEAESYRRIMRVLYDEHQAFGLRLRPAQVADRLRERYGWSIDLDWLEERLKALDGWGAVEADHDASLAATAAQWRRNRYTYDVTPAGRLTEELLAKLDALGEEVGRLDTARLPAIRDALALLAKALDQPEPDGAHLRQLFERVLAIDDDTRERVLAATVAFDLDVVMTSHELWGTYRSVPQLAIYQLHRENGTFGVHAIPFIWDGDVLRELEQSELVV